jgi:hypothetical protein
MRVRVLTGLISLAALTLTACGGGDSTGTHGAPAFMSKVGNDPAYVIAGASFSDSIRVNVTDASNKPASGASVSFDVISGGGSVTPATVIADASGSAAAKFITGATPGINTVLATVTGVSAVPSVAFSIITVAAGTIVWSSIPTDTLRGVWGTSASDVWAVGYHGALKHFNGTSWTNFTSGTTDPLVAVWGTSPSNVWTVGGFNGTILHYNGASWSSAFEHGQPGLLFGVWGGSPSDLWVVGNIDSVFHYNGTTWSNVAVITPIIFGMWGNTASDIWAVGYSPAPPAPVGTIFHYDGATWSGVAPGTTQGLSGVWGTSASDVWATGAGGVIVHYNGTSWSSVPSPPSQGLVSVWAASASDAWAVGYGGVIVHYNGTSWSSVTSGTTQDLFGVWGSSGSDIWAVGTGGLLHGVAAR